MECQAAPSVDLRLQSRVTLTTRVGETIVSAHLVGCVTCSRETVFRPHKNLYKFQRRKRKMDAFVSSYYLEWNPTAHTGAVVLKFSNGQQVNFKVTSLSDMAGWTALVNQRPLFVSADGSLLHTDKSNMRS